MRSSEVGGAGGGAREGLGVRHGDDHERPQVTSLTDGTAPAGVPPRPHPALSFTEGPPGLEVTWSPGVGAASEPVVFVLQARSNLGPHPSEDQASAWETAAQVQCWGGGCGLVTLTFPGVGPAVSD